MFSHRFCPIRLHGALLWLFCALLVPCGLADEAVTNDTPAIEQDVDVEA
ncbi:MAG: hypothetical protein ACI9X0_002434, partial [Kiritimatiellia bacterium]